MKRIIYAAAVALILAVGCAAPAAQVEPLESFRAAPGSGPTPNQSYLLKGMQEVQASCHAAWINDVANTALSIPGAWWHPTDVLFYPTWWRTDDQNFAFRGNDGGHVSNVTYTNARFPPGSGDIHYGPKRIAQNAVVDNDAKTKVIRNDGDTVIHVRYEETESLTNTFSTNVTTGLTIDVTATSSTSVEGEYAGVKASEAITTELGVDTSREETTEQGEEGSHSETLSIEFDADVGEYYLVTVSKEREVSYQDFDIDALMDWDMTFILETQPDARLADHYPGHTVTLTGGADGFNQFIRGYDTDYPQMQGFYEKVYARTRNGIACVLEPRRRHIRVSGTNQAQLESNADYRVEKLGTTLPDSLKHLPVEHAGDVNTGGV